MHSATPDRPEFGANGRQARAARVRGKAVPRSVSWVKTRARTGTRCYISLWRSRDPCEFCPSPCDTSTRLILILLVLSICAYLPALRLPFISDDYGEIPLARQHAAEGWTPLWYNTDLRARATYMFLSAAIDHVFGFTPMSFYAADIVQHAIFVLLIYTVHHPFHPANPGRHAEKKDQQFWMHSATLDRPGRNTRSRSHPCGWRPGSHGTAFCLT